ncbi:MAG: competence/damage-inducible protein A [Oscillospiraceae bacterium]|nr:competence/damage-inducible protein A [Oscillospiraceae bacterium]
MNAEIIAVGNEVLSGKQVNTNAQYLSEQLLHLGVKVAKQVCVGDSRVAIKSAVADALSHANIVVLTGGLGPTKDDITKDAVCELLNIKMTVNEEALKKIEAYFAKKGDKMPDNNVRQAMLPEGCQVLKNDNGLSPGCVLKSGNQCIILLPGPPHEMHPMFEKEVKPFVKTMSGVHSSVKTVNVFGMGESLIATALDDMIEKNSPNIATYAEGGKIDVCVTAFAETQAEADEQTERAVEEIKRRLGDAVYGVDCPSIQHAVVSRLVSEKITLATAESCTGGLISKKITDISGASLCFGLGITSYSEGVKNAFLGVDKTTLKELGAVSAETACQMAVGAMKAAGSDMAVAVTGYAGPAASFGEQVGLVFIAVCNSKTVWVKRYELAPRGNETREKIRELASMHAFDMIRKIIIGAAIFNCQRIPVSEISNSSESIDDIKGKLMFSNSAVEDEVEEKEQPAPVIMEGDNSFKAKMARFAFNVLPNKFDAVGEKIRKSVFLAALLLLIISASVVLNFFLGIQQNKNLYTNLETLKTEKPAPDIEYPDGYLEQFGLLYQENKDIVGWIEIEDSQINYPVVKTGDNDFYLTHNFYKKKERHGTPFMDYRNSHDQLNFNTVLHGHNMKSDNQMFSDLENYYKGNGAITYYRKHPLISFDTVYEEMDWKIFAVFTCSVNSNDKNYFDYYNVLNLTSNEMFDEFIGGIRSRSIFNIPVDVKPTDQILTLSTCYYEYEDQRLVVMARRVRSGESRVVDVNSATKNTGSNQNNDVSSGHDGSIYIPNEDDSSSRRPSSPSRPSYPSNNNTSSKPSSSGVSTSSDTEDETSSGASTSDDSTESGVHTDTETSVPAESEEENTSVPTKSENETSSKAGGEEPTPSVPAENETETPTTPTTPTEPTEPVNNKE